MSSLKASVLPPRLVGALTRSLYALGFSLAVSTLATQSHAACQYVVGGEWSNGFTASIKVTNNTTAAINGWSVGWQYTGDSRISGSYDVTMSGTNPYTASNAGWNGTIQPNQTVTFGFQGSKGAGAAEIPALTGAVCGTTAASSSVALSSSSRSSTPSSVAPSSSTRSSTPSSVASSSRASSSVAAGGYALNTAESYLNFVTTKNTSNVEAHNFISINGDINGAGVATLTIDLNTVNTGVSLRDQRMRDLLFEVASYPTATVTVNVPVGLISGLTIGQTSQTDITASLDLHGVVANITTKVSVQKLTASRVVVQSLPPVLVKADTYSLANGVEALRAAVGVASINSSVPVDFTLVFDAR